MKSLVVFEDAAVQNLDMVTGLRAAFDLRCGGRTLLERHIAAAGAAAFVAIVRPAVRDLVGEAHPSASLAMPARHDEAVFLNARLLLCGGDFARLAARADVAVWSRDALVALRTHGDAVAKLGAELGRRLDAGADGEPLRRWMARELPGITALALADEPPMWRDGSCLVDHVWDLVHHNGDAICDDFRQGAPAGIDAAALVYPGVHLLQDGAIRIGPGCRVKPGSVLDAEDGPIVLDRDVEVQPGVVVRGPVFVGAGSVLNAGAKIHAGTSFGPVCKIGGEIAESIVQGWSNKQHDGFLGHAYVGTWVNLGAGTNNSDLKNNYSNVRMWESGRMVDTGSRFMGLVAADHVKSAIQTSFNTGSVVGVCSQIFGAGFPPKFVAPFSWGGATGMQVHRFEAAVATARVVMQRRQVELTPAYEAALRRVFDAWRNSPRDGTPGD